MTTRENMIRGLASRIEQAIAATQPSVCNYGHFAKYSIDGEEMEDRERIGYDGEFDLYDLAEALLTPNLKGPQ